MADRQTVDIIEELRLRRWAREHYVAAADRDESWHPIILEEMRQRDAELAPAGPRKDAAATTRAVARMFPANELAGTAGGTAIGT